MAVVSSLRGDSIDLRYSNGGKTGVKVGSSASTEITVTADAGVLGGSKISFTGTTAKTLTWPGRMNTPNGRLLSCVVRQAPTYTGSPAGNRVLFPALYVGPDRMGRIEVYQNSAGNCIVTAVNEAGVAVLNAVNLGAYSPTAGDENDLAYTYNMAGGSNAFKLYNGTTLVGQATPTAAFTADWSNLYFNSISFGNMAISALAACDLIEWAFYDTIIDVSSVPLESGNGALGDARNSLLASNAFDGLLYSDPGIANVRLNTNYIYAGSTLTGSLGASTDPGVSNVRLATQYVIDGSTLTGTLNVPTGSSGTGSAVLLNDIKENIQYIFDQANTTTSTPVDLSANLTQRVKKVLKINPEMIVPQASFFPLVTCFIREKDIKRMDIAKTQLDSKRRATVKVSVVGSIWNSNITTVDQDPADEDINYLMENIELILRAHYNLGGKVNWQLAQGVKYFTSILDEQTHLRSGILDLDCEVFY